MLIERQGLKPENRYAGIDNLKNTSYGEIIELFTSFWKWFDPA